MKKPIRPIFWALSTFMLASTFCIYRVNSQDASPSQAQGSLPPETPEQRERREKFQAAWKQDKEQNYKAKLNNGSKRGGLRPEELPEKVRAEAEAAVQQYREKIYPNLKKYIAAHNGQLPEAASALPEFEPFMQDTQYKGVGPKMYGRGSWAIGIGFRMDGTVVSRDVYSGEPSDKPHDIWASYKKFADYPSRGKGFLINGWDDGRVTFDPVETNFYGERTLFGQKRPGAAVPGEAGIPPEWKQGLQVWFKKQDKDIQRDQAAKQGATKPNESKAGAQIGAEAQG